MENSHIESRIVVVVAIMCTLGIAGVVFLTVVAPYLNQPEGATLQPEGEIGLTLSFEGSIDGADDERGYGYGVSFVPGHSGQAVLVDNHDTLYYLTDENIHPHQGVIEFWVKPLWNGDDKQTYIFFELGDTWFNRFRITKDGANNFRFMVWSADTEYDAACSVSRWIANEWHQVRATWQGGRISLDLDGVLCDFETEVEMPEDLASRFYIGSSTQQDMQAQAVIDEFTIYSEP